MDSEKVPMEWKMNSNTGSVLVRCIYEPDDDDWLDLSEAFTFIIQVLKRIAAQHQRPIKVKWSDFYPEPTPKPE